MLLWRRCSQLEQRPGGQTFRLDLQRRAVCVDARAQRDQRVQPAARARGHIVEQRNDQVRRSVVPPELRIDGCGRRGDRFSLLKDFLYMNLGDPFEIGQLPRPSVHPVSTAVQRSVGMNVNAKMGTLAVGYALLKGVRQLRCDRRLPLFGGPYWRRFQPGTYTGRTSWQWRDVRGQRQRVRLANLWNGIGGFRGHHIRLGGDTALFSPIISALVRVARSRLGRSPRASVTIQAGLICHSGAAALYGIFRAIAR